MAHVLTSGEKAIQRLQRQWSKSYLAIPEYHVIYSARLDGVPTTNDLVAEIDFVNGIGTLADVLPDMTLYVGTSAGAYDLGMCRIRKAPLDDCTDGTFYIAETSEIEWVDDCYLTVVDDYQIWAKPLRIVSKVPYMDWDVTYSNQHTNFDPVPVMGSDAVAKLVDGTVDVLLGPSADTAAWVIGSTISSVLWTIDGAASIDDNTLVNPTATFTTAGTYLAYCLFTAANGKTFTGVRTVIIWDDASPLLSDFQIRTGRMGYDTGGCSFSVTLFSGFDRVDLRERTKVILCTEDFANNQQITLPGQIEGRENIVCIGWIANIDTSRQSEFGEISFTVESAEYWMKKIRDYPTGLQFKIGTAAAWTDMPLLTVDRALWHFLHWRSTATRVMDITLTNDSRMATRFAIARSNLWERLEQVASPTIFASAGVDNFGRLFVVIEPQMVPEADRTWPAVMTLTDDDLEDDINWTRRDVNEISMLFLSGISVDASKKASAFFSMSPGHSYGHHGEEDAQDNFLVASQSNSNQLCGLYYGWRNNDPYDLAVTFTHSMRVIGIFPRQKYHFTVSAANDPRGIGFDKDFIVREINFAQDAETGFISYTALLEPESVEGPAINGDVPTMETIDFSIPDFPIPIPIPLPPVITLPPTTDSGVHPKNVVIWSNNFGVLYTKDFDVTSPTWFFMNNGIATVDKTSIRNLVVTPSQAMYLYSDYGVVYYTTGLGGTWREIGGNAEFPYGVHSLGVNPTLSNTVLVLGLGLSEPESNWGNIYLANSGSLGSVVAHFPMRVTIGAAVWSAGKWIIIGSHIGFFASPYLQKHSANGIAETYNFITTAAGQDAADRYAQAIGSSDKVYQWDSSAAGGYNVITAGGMTVVRSTAFNPANGQQGLSMSPTGNFGMAANTGGTPYKTSDGTTWTSAAGVIPLGCIVWENCRDDFRWIFQHGNYVALTMDHGATYIDKIGNLLQIAPLMIVKGIRYIS